ncbi:MAG: TetR family transcriptional regulator [Deltaproteobacteria bacterium]|nr:TetR family transcriptional regulator [Deltaproteobacteria bacterium]
MATEFEPALANGAHEHHDMRDQILAAATRLFAAAGFDGTSLQDIADAVGIRKPSVLHHFPSKDAIRVAVLEALITRWKDVVPRILQAATTGQEGFDAAIFAVIDFFREDSARARLLVRELLDRPASLLAMFRDHLHPWIGLVVDTMRRGQQEGTVDSQLDVPAFVSQIVGMVISNIASSDVLTQLVPSDDDDVDPMDRQLREMIRIARRGFFANPERT